MTRRVSQSVVGLAVVSALLLTVQVLGAQSKVVSPTLVATPAPSKAWMPSRTPDGQPDLQGVWAIRSLTPLQRPADLAGKAVLTEEEAAAYEKLLVERRNKDTNRK